MARTTAATLLALQPLAATLLITMLVLGGAPVYWGIAALVAAVAVALTGVICVILARDDRRILAERGFTDPAAPSPYIAGIAPWLYLWLRGNRLFSDDPLALRPFWAYVGCAVVLVLSLTAFPSVANLGRVLIGLQ